MLTVLYDNHEGGEGLLTGWGFACVVDGFERTVLFDTGGEGEVLLRNMDRLGVEPVSVDAVVLSHEHWDHMGGLEAFLRRNPDVSVYLPGEFSGQVKGRVRKLGAEVVETADGTEVCPGISTTPVLGGAIREQGLCVESPGGPVLVTGCAHPGIVEMVRGAEQVFGEPARAALGGFHLKDSWATEINSIIARLRDLGVRWVGPCHCSGGEAREKMSRAFGEACIPLTVGSRVPLEALRSTGERKEST